MPTASAMKAVVIKARHVSARRPTGRNRTALVINLVPKAANRVAMVNGAHHHLPLVAIRVLAASGPPAMTNATTVIEDRIVMGQAIQSRRQISSIGMATIIAAPAIEDHRLVADAAKIITVR
jgi:hypothetical protein